jgi:ribosomal protein S18 acetylase RimI-like enzyme
MCYRASAGYEARLTTCDSLVLSGEPVVDLNNGVIDAGPQAEDHLREFVQLAGSKRIPVILMFTPEVAPQLISVARELGLESAGNLPLMVYSPEKIHLEESNFQTSRVISETDLKTSNSVMARAFNISSESVNRAFSSSYIQGPGVDLFLARKDDMAISTVQTTRAGSMVGIWAMATMPEQQRRGAGKAILNHVIAYHFERGAEHFFLVSTSTGKPLYDKIGFQTVAEGEVWVL